jgi:hypothetical protein
MNPRIVVALFLLISIGMCGMASASTHITDVHLNITPEDICEQNTVNLTFHLVTAMQPGNGFYVWLDPNICIQPGDLSQCITITYTGATSPIHPSSVVVFRPTEPGYLNCSPYGAGCMVKMWLDQGIPHNSEVTISFGDCVDPTCPCFCSGYRAWVSNDFYPCAWEVSDTVHMKVRVEGIPGDGGTMQLLPSGPVHATNFTDYFWCMANASYKIKADPCKIISNITVTPICPQLECINCTPPGYTCPCELDPDCVVAFLPLADQELTEYTYTFTYLRCCYQIWAQFENKTCNVTAQPGPNGGILSPDGIWAYYPGTHSREFYCGEIQPYLIKPNISYSIENVTVNGVEVPFDPLVNGSAIYYYTSDCNDAIIGANFTMSPVDAFLKYQLPRDQCGDIVEVQVRGMDHIGPMVEFADDFYLGGNSSVFNISGTSSGAFFGGYNGSGFVDGFAYPPGDSADVDVLSVGINPETYRVTYVDSGPSIRYATVTILTDGTPIWAPAVPSDITDITNIEALMPAWQMVTQDYLDANPSWEGPVGMVVYVANGTYNEVFEVDTPGLHLKNFPGAEPVIDANGMTVGSGDYESAVWLSAGCTGIEGFTITDSGANGIAVYPSSEKCQNASILDWFNNEPVNVSCAIGRVNIVNNTIYGNDENGIRAINCVVLILNNIIHDNVDDGIDAGCLFTGVECVDPEAITHSPAASEIIWNTIYGNGPSGNGDWEVGDPPRFTSDPTACVMLPGWTDSGIQIRCIGQGRQGIDQVVYIVHNNIHDNYHAGIYLWAGATLGGNLTIQQNKLIDNGIFGLSTRAADPGRIDFRYNDIIGNTYWGVKNWDDDVLIAKENYWGDPGGPSEGPAPIVQCIECRCHEEDQRSDALGYGDAVSHLVHYNPWLYVSAAAVFHDTSSPVRMYGSDSLLLQSGWNTLSVPCKLAEVADTIGEIETIGDFVTSANAVVVYKWDAATDMWVNVGSSGEKIAPGRGYYIKMKSPSRFPVLYNGNPSPGLPSIPLENEWNLIGAPWGIDRSTEAYYGGGICDGGICAPPHDSASDQGRWGVASPDDYPTGDPEAFMLVREALESIKEGNGGTKGVAIIVSPSVPGQLKIWSTSVTTGFWEITNSREMATGEAYWVFMVNPATYGGFEITPFYFPT